MTQKFFGLHLKWWGLLALLVVGFGLRAYGIDRYGLWIDEITTAQCLDVPLWQIGDCYWVQVGSPVLFVATNLVYVLFGSPALPVPEWMVRLPELLAGTLTIAAAWLAARELMGARAAWLNALLWTFAPTAVAYSQEARMYAWLMLFSNLSAWLLVRTLRRGSWRGGIVYGIVAGLNFYSHYLAVFVIAAQLLFAGAYVLHCKWRAPEQLRRVFFAGIAFVGVPGIFVLLWLPNISKMSVAYLSPGATTRLALSFATLADAQTWMVLNRVDVPLLAFVLVGLEIVGAWRLWRHARGALLLTALWLALPLLFLVIQQGSWTAMRYWVVILPPVFWLLTASLLALIDRLEKFLARRQIRTHRLVPIVAIALCSVLLLLPALYQFYTDQFESWRFDDWRGAAQLLRAQSSQGDLILAFGDAAPYHVMALDYYLGDARTTQAEYVTGDTVAHAENSQGRVWAIAYARDESMRERLRTLLGAQDEIFWFRNLALVSAPAQTNQRASAAHLLMQLRALNDAGAVQALALFGNVPRGENLLANPQPDALADGSPLAWEIENGRGQMILQSGRRALQLAHQANDAPATATQRIALEPAQTYVLQFECRRTVSRGTLRTFVILDGADGKPLMLPRQGGYVCPRGDEWHSASFAFRVPDNVRAALTARIVLQNQGVGDALWRSLSLQRVLFP